LARALVKEANVTFFDEPLSNIEPTLRGSFIADFQKIKVERNATYVYSTHRLEEAFALADQMAILQKGEILQVGSPKTLLSKPKNEAVFSFLNSEGTFFFFLPLKNQTLTIGGSSFSFPCPDGFYDFGFRSVDVVEKEGGFAADISRIEYLGGQQKASFKVVGSSLQGSFLSEKIHDVGDRVFLSISKDAIAVFDAKNKQTVFFHSSIQ
jgi:ABC-type sugar transport system ATPase subunit